VSWSSPKRRHGGPPKSCTVALVVADDLAPLSEEEETREPVAPTTIRREHRSHVVRPEVRVKLVRW